MLQQDQPQDYVIATGVTHSVRDLVEVAFAHVGLDYRSHIEVDPSLLRPAEVHHLRGDYSRAARELGWKPKTSFEQLVAMMVDADLARLSDGSSAPWNDMRAREPWGSASLVEELPRRNRCRKDAWKRLRTVLAQKLRRRMRNGVEYRRTHQGRRRECTFAGRVACGLRHAPSGVSELAASGARIRRSVDHRLDKLAAGPGSRFSRRAGGR